MPRRALVLLLGALALLALPLSAGGQDSLEAELLGLINQGRPSRLTAHSGLRIVGREHSREMASDGGLNHNGAADRINRADPDPTESNGAPDDGFTGTWCENVAFVRGAPDSEVPERMYNAWRDSPSHERCMNNGEMTVAGVGMYYDSSTGRWWATYESAVDNTLPGTTPQTPEPTATSAPVPTERPERTEPPLLAIRTEPPEPTERPEPTTSAARARNTNQAAVEVEAARPAEVSETVGAVAEAASGSSRSGASSAGQLAASAPSAARTTFGWMELAATLAALALVGELLRRISRRSGSETT